MHSTQQLKACLRMDLAMVSKGTLENAMLYANLVKKVHRIDPGFDVQLIDRTLEPSEAEGDLRKKGHLVGSSGRKERSSHTREYRDYLHDQGIRHPSLQNFVMRQDKPTPQEDIDQLAYIASNRPHKNIKMDIKRKARPAKTVRQYARNPNRYDVAGVDTPGSMFDPDLF